MPPVMTAGNGRGEGSSNSWYSIRAAANNTAEVRIYDEIGGWGISARWFAEELAALGQINRINLHIHSPGGAVLDGIAIYNLLTVSYTHLRAHETLNQSRMPSSA